MKRYNVDLSGKDTSQVTTVNRMFKDFGGTSINMSGCDLSNSTVNTNFIYNSPELVEFIPPININSSMTVTANSLPVEVFEAIIENLLEVVETQTLLIGTTNLNKLSEEQIAKAVAKNWSIA